MRPLFYNKAFQEEFEKNGFVRVNLLDEDQVQYLANLEDELSPAMANNFYTSIWSSDKEYRKVVDKKLKEFYIPLLQDYLIDCKPVFANFMVKKPGSDSEIGLHQDWTFVEEDQYPSVNVWCPLVDTSFENGRLSIVENSHKLSLPRRGRDVYSPIQEISDYIFNHCSTGLNVNAGEAIIYDARLLHGSVKNSANEKRVATSIVMIPEEAELLHYVNDQENDNQIVKLSVTEDFFTEFGLYENPVPFFTDKEVVPYQPYALSFEDFDNIFQSINPHLATSSTAYSQQTLSKTKSRIAKLLKKLFG